VTGELLLELLSEEIPARMQRRAIDDLVTLIRDKLADAEIPAENLKGYVTPRRLTVIATGIPERQPHRSEERRGPRVGAPPNAIEGFLRSAGLASVDQCEVRDTGRGEFYFAKIERPGRPAAEVLPELLRAAIGELPWPKSMRFPASTLHWVRPLTSVICLFDGVIIKIPLDEVPVGRMTRGHRFLALDPIEVANGSDYLSKLGRAYVMLDSERRRKEIEDGLEKAASLTGVRFKSDPGLLDEVTGLVEWPSVLSGQIDPEFMALPAEVLATAMRTHQKYFSCLNPDGSLAPRFLFVANNLTPDDGTTIIAGNERVLKARLADARFFWDQDRKVPLEARVEALKERVYHAQLGTMYDKAERTQELAQDLALRLDFNVERARRAARLAKADLSTGMVGEFPELQGVMGRYYAEHDREDWRVATAIAEHYKPLGPNDSCPTEPESVAVALADKIDTLASFFSVGERPSGSGDPFALRRAALGVIRIILENNLTLRMTDILGRGIEIYVTQAKTRVQVREVVQSLMYFFGDRITVHLRQQGVRHDLIAAIFIQGEDDLVRLMARAAALREFLGSDDGQNLLVAYRRASNIVEIEQKKGGWEPGELRTLQLPEEQALADALDGIKDKATEQIAAGRFEQAMAALSTLRRPVDEFFDKVTVNTDAEDGRLRENRLRLLSRIRAVMNQVADFSQIEG
jgi:glycyl-tRNA synthetase beta chain